MKRLILLTMIVSSSLFATIADSEPTVRVAVVQEVPFAWCEVRGDYKVFDETTKEQLSSSSFGKKFKIQANAEGISWGEEFPDVSSLRISPKQDHFVYVNGIQYKGDLVIAKVSDKLVTVVNEVAIDDFLKSTLSYRRGLPKNKESLAAWVITERTKVLDATKQNSLFDFEAKKAHYYGYGVTLRNSSLEDTVHLTKNIVLEGMSPVTDFAQNNAEVLAKEGFDAKDILSKLFPHHHLNVAKDSQKVARK